MRLLAEGGCTLRDDGRTAGVGWGDERYLNDKGGMFHRKYNTKVAVLDSATGTLD